MTEAAPLTPADCDLRDFPRMVIDIPRLFASEFDATDDDTAWRLGVTLWLKSFHQVPAASLPDDDAQLAKLCGLGRDTRTWRRVREAALHGWVKATDGLLYHPVVAEMALEAWLEKLTQRLSSGAGNAARWQVEFDPEPIRAEIAAAALLLAKLNPKSKALSKQQAALALRKSRRETPSEVPAKVPVGSPEVPAGSQEKGREGIEDSDPDGSAGEPASNGSDELADLRALDLRTGAWRLALKVLMNRGGFPEARARPLVGKWAKTVSNAELWQVSESAWNVGTLDPVSYITAAIERLKAEAVEDDALRNPSEMRQRLWMEDWRANPALWREHERGPRPGDTGCRVAPELQREFGVEPAPPQPVRAA